MDDDIRCMMVILALLASLSIAPQSRGASDEAGLRELISENEDALMSAKDLAFLLVTHDFNAAPKKDYVEVHLNKTVYRLVPNGSGPGLANITIQS
jgi:hypothetical protein